MCLACLEVIQLRKGTIDHLRRYCCCKTRWEHSLPVIFRLAFVATCAKSDTTGMVLHGR